MPPPTPRPASTFTKATYYAVLGLTPAAPQPGKTAHAPTTKLSSEDVKKAYRRALLNAHPDKRDPAAANDADEHDDSSSHATLSTPTIDDVKEAYAVLSDAPSRRAYDAWLRSRSRADARGDGLCERERVGMEMLDLDDFREEGDGRWTRGCRCGMVDGFCVAEEELEGVVARGESEVLVGCGGCSLWVRVGFGVVEG